MKINFTNKLCDKVTRSDIPENEQILFVAEVVRRYNTGSYRLPESMVSKYRQYLKKSLHNGCKYFYLRELVYLPDQAINDYYLIMKRNKNSYYSR